MSGEGLWFFGEGANRVICPEGLCLSCGCNMRIREGGKKGCVMGTIYQCPLCGTEVHERENREKKGKA